ncbi:toll-like receptor 9 [Ictalurus furcatus]|uniref:toll-like receptor 9 n=1 Tax=Ictalurus furcatus TaxID=66913 RepID=UPI002350C4E6|nr:toll-like receptor 9 [Ictalurus furcatus]
MQMLLFMFGPGLYLFFVLDQLNLVKTMNPKFYPCDNNTNSDGNIHLDCKRRDLMSIPKFMSFSIISLNLDENRIHQVKRHDFSDIPNLQSLSLMWNCLPGRLKALKLPSCQVFIDPEAFVNLKNLTFLQLAGNSLKTIPLLPQHLEVLGLEFNNIFRIEQPLGTPFLKQLLLAKNCYYANPCNESFFIDQMVFQDLPELQNLTLGFNNMSSVPKQLPSSLESLDLTENRITEIWESSFTNLTKLSFLNLQWNCQRCDHAAQPCFPCPNNSSLGLHDNAFFDQRDSLVILSLRGNSIYSISKNLFAQLKKLKTLDLSENLLAYSIRNGTFYEELQGVVSLNLLYNYQPLKTFSELILSPSISRMKSLRNLHLSGLFFHQLSNNSLRPLFNLTQLEYLDLRMNFISSCNVTAFNQLRSLKMVVLSQNMLTINPYYTASSNNAMTLDRYQRDDHLKLQDMPTFESKLQMNYLHCTDKECPKSYSMLNFQKCFCYRKLFFDLSQNNIPWLNASTFKGMEKTMCLDLSYNYMSQTLNGQQFYPLTKLVYLNMAHNRIDLYFNEAFQELRRTLKALDLSNNEFHFQMRGIGHRFTFIKNLTSLEVLSLANNNIGMRISNTLYSTSLKCLLFSGNRLDIMWDTSGDQYIRFFQGLTNLTYLDISDNKLRSCSPEAIVNLPPSIRVLKMDSNLLNYFPWNNISVLSQLCYLNLSGNYLFNLPDSVIYFGIKLRSLDLSHNRLSAIPESFFSQATGLKELMLNHNQLKILEMHALPPSLQKGNTICITSKTSCKLTLHANPFTCSCATSWFTDFLRTSPVDIPHLTTDVRCGFPESQTGVNVLSIDPRSCQEIFGSVSFLFTFLLTIAATAIPLLRHLYGWDLWYCFQILWAGHKGYTPLHGNNMNNQHDAFVVFDTKNKAVRDWIYNEMLINLESRGRWKFRLCLEERDWIPGVSCIENLHNAVYNSRKTVFVLTNQGGCASVNGVIKQAFILVQQRLLDEKVDVAIVVLLDPLFPKLKYLQMRKRLCRKSVLSWPKNPRAQPLFWNNLHIALASDNVRSYDKKVTESFLSNELI